MSHEQKLQLSNNIKDCRNSINQTKSDLINLNNDALDYRRRRILQLRLIGLKLHLRNLENQVILLQK